MSKSFEENIEIARKAWDSYHPAWIQMLRKQHPGREQRLASGEVLRDVDECQMLGDIKGKRVLALACGPDATQAFSLANLGAQVTACDISSSAIEIARKIADEIGIDVTFVVAESQTLPGIADGAYDLVYAQMNFCYYEDLPKAFATWYRVLHPGGRLFAQEMHFVTQCLEEVAGSLTVTRRYDDSKPHYCTFIGTPMAAAHGWSSDLPDVEFPHTLAELLNAMAAAGFVFERMMEPSGRDEKDTPISKLPASVLITATKPDQGNMGEHGLPADADRPRH